MRQFKFRAWDKITKQIFEVKEIDFNAMERNIYGYIATNSIFGKSDTELQWRSFDKVELMQFTGSKDKNRVEIYEGDIVKYVNELYTVEFLNGGFFLKCTTELDSDNSDLIYGVHFSDVSSLENNCEVVGNIYENNELLMSG